MFIWEEAVALWVAYSFGFGPGEPSSIPSLCFYFVLSSSSDSDRGATNEGSTDTNSMKQTMNLPENRSLAYR